MIINKRTLLAFAIAIGVSRVAGCGMPDSTPDAQPASGPAAGFSGPISPQGGTVTNSATLNGSLAIGTGATAIGNYSGTSCGSGLAVKSLSNAGVATCATAGISNSAGSGTVPLTIDGAGDLGTSPITVSGGVLTEVSSEFDIHLGSFDTIFGFGGTDTYIRAYNNTTGTIHIGDGSANGVVSVKIGDPTTATTMLGILTFGDTAVVRCTDTTASSTGQTSTWNWSAQCTELDTSNTGTYDMTGIAPPPSGVTTRQTLKLFNKGTGELWIFGENALSSTTSRFTGFTTASFPIDPGTYVDLTYDPEAQSGTGRWACDQCRPDVGGLSVQSLGDAGALNVNGNTTLQGSLTVGGIFPTPITPSALSGTVIDWSPGPSWTNGNSSVLKTPLSANATLYSLLVPGSPEWGVICNETATFGLTIVSDDGTHGTATERFLLQGAAQFGTGAQITLNKGECIGFYYDNTQTRWVEWYTTGDVQPPLAIAFAGNTLFSVTPSNTTVNTVLTVNGIINNNENVNFDSGEFITNQIGGGELELATFGASASQPVTVNHGVSTGTGGFQVWSGGASPTEWFSVSSSAINMESLPVTAGLSYQVVTNSNVLTGTSGPPVNGTTACNAGDIDMSGNSNQPSDFFCTKSATWTPLISNSYFNTHLEWDDDWLFGPSSASPYTANSTAMGQNWFLSQLSGPTGVYGVSGGGRPGIIVFDDGTALTSTQAAFTGNSAFDVTNGVAQFTWVGGWPTLSATAQTSLGTYASIIGFADGAVLNEVNGCYFLYDAANVATGGLNSGHAQQLEAVCANNGTRTVYLLNGTGSCDVGSKGTATVSALTLPNTGILNLHVRVVNSGGTSPNAVFQVNGTSVCTINTNVPSTSGRSVGAIFALLGEQTSTGASRQMDTDYTSVTYDFNATVRSP